MLKKKYALVLAFGFCLATTLFIVIGTGYDPWIDYDDGYIGSADAVC